jgi:GNAT superfamily N-acetyltransferase
MAWLKPLDRRNNHGNVDFLVCQHFSVVVRSGSMRAPALKNTDRLAELIERDAWLDLFACAPDQVRDSLGLASTTISGMGLLGCRAIPITELNRAMAVGAESAPSTDDLDAVVSWLDEHAVSWALQIAPGAQRPILDDYLARAAMSEAGSGWAKFVTTDAVSPRAPIEGAARIEVVGDVGANAFSRTVVEGFGLPVMCEAWFAALANRPSWQCFGVLVDGEVAGVGSMFVRDGAAWFGIEATRPAFRGRGIQRSIVAAQVSAAAAAGATILTCETSQPVDPADKGFSSYRNQERAGLLHRYVRPNFKRAA